MTPLVEHVLMWDASRQNPSSTILIYITWHNLISLTEALKVSGCGGVKLSVVLS